MKIQLFDGLVGPADTATVRTWDVKEGQSIVFLENSVMNPILCARFYDSNDTLHVIDAKQIVSIDPS